MPAGVTWGKYIKVTGSSLLSMFAGAQLVHVYYQPLKDLDRYVEMEMNATTLNDIEAGRTKSKP